MAVATTEHESKDSVNDHKHLPSRDAVPAMLFDLDGTLIDSVYQHVLAWNEALERAGNAALRMAYPPAYRNERRTAHERTAARDRKRDHEHRRNESAKVACRGVCKAGAASASPARSG